MERPRSTERGLPRSAIQFDGLTVALLTTVLSALLATVLPALAALLAALSGLLVLLAGLLATTLLLTGLLLAALLAFLRVLRILAHRGLHGSQPNKANSLSPRSFRTATWTWSG